MRETCPCTHKDYQKYQRPSVAKKLLELVRRNNCINLLSSRSDPELIGHVAGRRTRRSAALQVERLQGALLPGQQLGFRNRRAVDRLSRAAAGRHLPKGIPRLLGLAVVHSQLA